MSRHLGLDLGGTNVKWAVVESGPDGIRMVDHGQAATERASGPDGVLAELVRVGGDAASAAGGVASAGVGVPGRYDPATGTTRFIPNIPGDWSAVPVGARVEHALGVPAHLINDARAFTLAELRLGAGRGATGLLGITVGTGVGGGIAIGGRLFLGRDGTAGEFGHQTVLPDGPGCSCGNRGCLEPLANAGAVVAACGRPSVEEAVAAARAGDRRALAGLAQVGAYLGIGVANVVCLLTPDRVIVGGGVAAAGDLLLDPLRAELRRRVHITDPGPVEVLPAELGFFAGAIGAAVHGMEAATG